MKTDRAGLIRLVQEEYSTEPEYPWENDAKSAVFRRMDNRKWFGVMMEVSGGKIGLEATRMVDILNVKCDPLLLGSALQKPGCFPAYHMNKSHWITLLLDGTVPEEELRFLLAMSYDLTAPKARKRAAKGNRRIL